MVKINLLVFTALILLTAAGCIQPASLSESNETAPTSTALAGLSSMTTSFSVVTSSTPTIDSWGTPVITNTSVNFIESADLPSIEAELFEEIEIIGECVTSGLGGYGYLTGGLDVSQDGQYIVVSNGSPHIYIMKLDQNQLYSQMEPVSLVTITSLNQEASQVDWSPDGQSLAILAKPTLDEFIDNVPDNADKEQIYIISVDGQQKVRLTDTPDDKLEVQWSPDGQFLMYETVLPNTEGKLKSQIHILDLTANQDKQLVGNEGWNAMSTWSPDSQSVAFSFRLHPNVMVNQVINLESMEITTFPEVSLCSGDMAWSPDGSRVAFVSKLEREWDLFVMNRDGTDIQRMTSNLDGHVANPVWSPNGEKIAFVIYNDSYPFDSNLAMVQVDNRDLIRLTSDNEESEYSPLWLPDSRSIIFASDSIENGKVTVYVDILDTMLHVRLRLFEDLYK